MSRLGLLRLNTACIGINILGFGWNAFLVSDAASRHDTSAALLDLGLVVLDSLALWICVSWRMEMRND